MKCPKCNETDHEPTAKYCHVCGTELQPTIPTRNKNRVGNPFKRMNDAIENSGILYGLIMVLAWIIPIAIILVFGLSVVSVSYDCVDTASEEAWQNRRLDPHKYDYILNGEPEPEPVTGTLIVDSSPQGATVYLDGKKTGLKTPATINEITEGKHTVSVKLKRTRINNTWFQMGEKPYPILFTIDKDSMSIVRYKDNMAGSMKETIVIKSKKSKTS